MKIVFLGTPDFSVKVLKDLVASKHEVVAVVTQPDKPVGRSKKLTAPPVKSFAIANNIPVLQFKRIRKAENIKKLKEFNADIMITAAYGQILTQEVLDITPFGVYNVHASLLPKYRGAAPIQWAIINGETVTGITIMKTELGLDSGPVLLQKEIKIEKADTSDSLFEKMSDISGKVLLEALSMLESGNFTLIPQNESQSTHYPMFKKEFGKIDFNKTAKELDCFIRGVTSWPGAYTYIDNKIFKIFKIEKFTPATLEEKEKINSAVVGQVVFASTKKGLVVKVKEEAVRLVEVQAFSKKRMSDVAYLNGSNIKEGLIFEK